MLHLFLKDYLPFFFNAQFIPNFILLILGLILTHNKHSPFVILLSIMILYFYSYFIHIAFHYFPDIINIHLKLHHSKENDKSIITKYLNLLIELSTNIMFFVIFYYTQKLLHIDFVPEIIIFYYGFIYTSVHIINYSIFHATDSHVLHHKSAYEFKSCNYGPDLVDHIFHTNCNNKIEDYKHIIPNTLISFLLTYYFYKPKLF